MKRLRFISIIVILWIYTTFKISEISPSSWMYAPWMTSGIFFIMISWMFVYRSYPELLNNFFFKLLAWIGSLTMGVWSTFILLSIPIDILLLAKYLVTHLVLHTYDFTKSSQFSHAVSVGILFISFGIAIVGLIQAWLGPRIKNVNVKIADLPASLNNFTIAQISDLHIGPTIRNGYVERVVALTNAIEPDIIVVTGDLSDAQPQDIKNELNTLTKLNSKLGIFYITGNHEYYWDPSQLFSLTKTLGYTWLINENKTINYKGANLLIAGITDPVGAQYHHDHIPNMPQASATSSANEFKILLSHRPGVFAQAEALGFDLQLSGHTHAGQFFPLNFLIHLVHTYYQGLNKFGRLWIYVNPGTGYWGPANRFYIPSEISVLRLKTANRDEG